jgi:Zn finger protein HypA/HybF involved in hydrogenase expression
MKLWWCVECQAKVGLGKHGRCESCGSEAVDLMSDNGNLTRSTSAAAETSDSASACS